jgi:O-glycosyl hydrolase
VLSVQNEPHTQVSYEGCYWEPAEIQDFLKVLGERFKEDMKNVQTTLGIMAPEDENFKEDMITASLADAEAKRVLTHVSVHQYESGYVGVSQKLGAEKFTQTAAAGKRIWETEIGNSAGEVN